MHSLVIRKEAGEGAARFVVQRVDGRGAMAALTVVLEDPLAQVLGETQLRLGAGLTWYLETYLEYPFGPNQERAERVVQSLGEWGRQSFEALLGQGRARDFYRDAIRNGHAELQLVVDS